MAYLLARSFRHLLQSEHRFAGGDVEADAVGRFIGFEVTRVLSVCLEKKLSDISDL
ncbi:hypothetical protein MESS2_1650028 [Mesorhizobium metallidurans STM 2683]|uniref:Uncharacterized protein n=1 Tax=Mesorhizobium metallidurans STM 2683 TaxID=1297569 RepID=M5ENJ4_9HYPH|nr:hypothetical protein MESS2_1650028 [Mesorhizobium metallidurans STM 2683]